MEMEQLMQEGKELHEQRFQQMERKFIEEKLQQQQELDKALESKLAEQKELMQKGFDEKAQMKDLEIEQLNKEKDQLSQSFYKDYIIPGVDIAKELFTIYMKYKAIKSVYP